MKISVLLPVYNAGLPLRLAIESILAQELEDFEFLIIEDASTDGSAGIVREYAGRDSRIHAKYHMTNQGLAKTLNEGLDAAEGELVARMDQDDEALPHRLTIQQRFMSTRPEVAVAGSFVFHMGSDRQRDRLVRLPTSHSEIAKTLKRENCLYHPSTIMRRKDILRLGGYRSEFKNAEDYDLWLRVSRIFQMANIPVALIRYRFSVAGMTLSRKWEQLYYFYLAQVAQEDSEKPFSAHEERARERLAEIDRASFMGSVAAATAEELVRLGFYTECLRLLRFFFREIGRKNVMVITYRLYRKRHALGLSSL